MLTLKIKLSSDIEEKINYLIAKQGNIENFLKDFLIYKTLQLEKAIFEMEKDLHKYERKYKISSSDFYKKYESGEFEDKNNYMIWAGIYEMIQENKDELKKLK